MTHKEEIKYWSEHPDGTQIWKKVKGFDWVLNDNNATIWNPDKKYIVNNQWAELRKAQADGKQLQWFGVNAKLDYDLISDTDINDWHIEPTYEWQWHYKVGDNPYSLTDDHYLNIKEVIKNLSIVTDLKITVYDEYEPSKRERK